MSEKKVRSRFNPVPGGPQQSMTYNDLAGLMALFLWMDDGTTPYQQFETKADPANGVKPDPKTSQADAIQQLIDNGALPKLNNAQQTGLFDNWSTITNDPLTMQRLNTLHLAVRDVVEAIGANWDGCSSLTVNMLTAIANT